MGFLASLLPGIRDLRTPMSAGILWLSVAAIFLIPSKSKILDHSSEATELVKLVKSAPTSAAIPILLASAYILGSVMTTVTLVVMQKIGKGFSSLLTLAERVDVYRDEEGRLRSRKPFWLYRIPRQLEVATSPVSLTARGLVVDATQHILGRVNVPGEAILVYPIEHAMKSLRYSAAHLAVAAPALYQEYDRFRSEAEFRIAISPPLIALAAFSPLQTKSLIVFLVIGGCGVLLAQAIAQIRAGNNILANAVYLDHATLPSVQSVADTLKSLNPQPMNDSEWIGALIASMNRKGLFDSSDSAVHELLEFELDKIEQVANYLKMHDSISYELLIRLMGQYERPGHLEILERLGVEDGSAGKSMSESPSDVDTSDALVTL